MADPTITERMRRYRARIRAGVIKARAAPRVPQRYRKEFVDEFSERARQLDATATALRERAKKQRGDNPADLLAQASDAAAMAAWYRVMIEAAKGGEESALERKLRERAEREAVALSRRERRSALIAQDEEEELAARPADAEQAIAACEAAKVQQLLQG